MAKENKKKNVMKFWGNTNHVLNPKGLTKKYRAVCITDSKIISPKWRDSYDEALEDATTHIQIGHYIDIEKRIFNNGVAIR